MSDQKKTRRALSYFRMRAARLAFGRWAEFREDQQEKRRLEKDGVKAVRQYKQGKALDHLRQWAHQRAGLKTKMRSTLAVLFHKTLFNTFTAWKSVLEEREQREKALRAQWDRKQLARAFKSWVRLVYPASLPLMHLRYYLPRAPSISGSVNFESLLCT